MKIIVYFL